MAPAPRIRDGMGHHCPDPAGERGRGCQRRALAQRPEVSCTHNHPKILCPQKGRAGRDDAGHPSGMKGWGGILEKLLLILKGEWEPPSSPVHPPLLSQSPSTVLTPGSSLPQHCLRPGARWLRCWQRAQWPRLPRWPGAWPPPASCCCCCSSAPSSTGTFTCGGRGTQKGGAWLLSESLPWISWALGKCRGWGRGSLSTPAGDEERGSLCWRVPWTHPTCAGSSGEGTSGGEGDTAGEQAEKSREGRGREGRGVRVTSEPTLARASLGPGRGAADLSLLLPQDQPLVFGPANEREP